jgi:hypothetical protein
MIHRKPAQTTRYGVSRSLRGAPIAMTVAIAVALGACTTPGATASPTDAMMEHSPSPTDAMMEHSPSPTDAMMEHSPSPTDAMMEHSPGPS